MTVLQMVQNILSAMDEQEVNSIGDTIISEQVAEELRTTYFENLGNFEVKLNQQLVQFDALTDQTDHPHILRVPDNVDEFYFIKYNINTVASPDYKDVDYCEPKEFMDRLLSQTSGTRINVKDNLTDLPYTIRSDKRPHFWTTFDNEHIVFDSINRALDDTIQESKVMAMAQTVPTFTLTDTFIPDIETKYFPMLLAEAKSAAWINQKGVSNSKEEQRARRQRVRHTRHKHRYVDKEQRTNFGRNS